MEYKEFDKKRRWYRFRKIFKNILIATLILYTCEFLANAATNNFLNNCLYNESGGETTSESGSGDEGTSDGSGSRHSCYLNDFWKNWMNLFWFVNIMYMTLVWLIFKILKADMGFRCTSVPCCSHLVSGLMTLLRFLAFFFGVLVFIFGFLIHFVWTFVLAWWSLMGDHADEKEIKKVD